MQKEPINVFESEEQLEVSLREWQERLFLKDWVIKAILVDKLDDGSCGLNERLQVEKYCLIKISSSSKNVEIDNFIIGKQPQELILIHELLHCLIEMHIFTKNNVFDNIQHRLIEQMSKSLLMAKYNLDFSYFEGQNGNK